MNTTWTRPYARQPEILSYMEHCAEKYEVLPHCRFNDAVTSARWDDESATWTLTTESGAEVTADVVISALGMFNDVPLPDIEGLGDFEGKTIHSARWDWDHDLTGETVGVIGSAASAVQLVPEIALEVGQLQVFQRTRQLGTAQRGRPLHRRGDGGPPGRSQHRGGPPRRAVRAGGHRHGLQKIL